MFLRMPADGAALTAKELRVREQLHEVWSISGLDVVPLQMQRYILEGCGIAVDVQRSHTISTLILTKLFFEELREI